MTLVISNVTSNDFLEYLTDINYKNKEEEDTEEGESAMNVVNALINKFVGEKEGCKKVRFT